MPTYTASKTIRTKNSIYVGNSSASTGTLTVQLGDLNVSAGAIPAGESRIVEINGACADMIDVKFVVTGSVSYEITQAAN